MEPPNFRQITIAALLSATAVSHATELRVGDAAPVLPVQRWVQGQPVSNGPGSVRVVEFWATWCAPCKMSIPALTEMSKKYANKVDFASIDVYEHSNDDLGKVTNFVRKMGGKMPFAVAVDGPSGATAKAWLESTHQNHIPTAFVVDQTGRIVWVGQPTNGLDEALDQVLAGTFDLKRSEEAFELQVATAEAQAKIIDSLSQDQRLYDSGERAEALAAMDQIGKQHPDQEDRVLLAKFEALYSDNKPAAMSLARQISAPGKKVAPYLLLKMANSVAHRPDASAADLKNSISIAETANRLTRSQNPLILSGLGMMYHAAHRTADAIRVTRLAVSVVPDTPLNQESTFVQHIRERLHQYEREGLRR